MVQWRLIERVADVDLCPIVDQDLGELLEPLFGGPVERRYLAALVSLGGEERSFEEWQQEDEVWTGFKEVFETGLVEVRGDLLEELVGKIEELHDRKKGNVVYLRKGGGGG